MKVSQCWTSGTDAFEAFISDSVTSLCLQQVKPVLLLQYVQWWPVPAVGSSVVLSAPTLWLFGCAFSPSHPSAPGYWCTQGDRMDQGRNSWSQWRGGHCRDTSNQTGPGLQTGIALMINQTWRNILMSVYLLLVCICIPSIHNGGGAWWLNTDP